MNKTQNKLLGGDNNKSLLSLTFVLAAIIMVPSLFGLAIAETQTDDLTPIGTNMAIEKSTVSLYIPENNSLPWAFIEGKVNNPVADYPIIIQIYDDDDQVLGNSIGGIHFAQTDVSENGTYEYKFRISDVSDGSAVNLFEGHYTVKIFKVVYLDVNLGLA